MDVITDTEHVLQCLINDVTTVFLYLEVVRFNVLTY